MLREEATVLTGMLIGLSAIDFRCILLVPRLKQVQESGLFRYSAPCSPGAQLASTGLKGADILCFCSVFV